MHAAASAELVQRREAQVVVERLLGIRRAAAEDEADAADEAVVIVHVDLLLAYRRIVRTAEMAVDELRLRLEEESLVV